MNSTLRPVKYSFRISITIVPKGFFCRVGSVRSHSMGLHLGQVYKSQRLVVKLRKFYTFLQNLFKDCPPFGFIINFFFTLYLFSMVHSFIVFLTIIIGLLYSRPFYLFFPLLVISLYKIFKGLYFLYSKVSLSGDPGRVVLYSNFKSFVLYFLLRYPKVSPPSSVFDFQIIISSKPVVVSLLPFV